MCENRERDRSKPLWVLGNEHGKQNNEYMNGYVNNRRAPIQYAYGYSKVAGGGSGSPQRVSASAAL